jgi:hypothetical protein
MKNLLFLCICLLCSSCATEPTSPTTRPKQTLPSKETQPPILENLKIGMPRAEAERILGSPTSVTDTATGDYSRLGIWPRRFKSRPTTRSQRV